MCVHTSLSPCNLWHSDFLIVSPHSNAFFESTNISTSRTLLSDAQSVYISDTVLKLTSHDNCGLDLIHRDALVFAREIIVFRQEQHAMALLSGRRARW